MFHRKKYVTALRSKGAFEKLIIKVMQAILCGENPFEAITDKYTKQEILEVLYFCHDNKLIHGLHPMRTASGDVTCDTSAKLTVSYEGLKFMYDCKSNESLKLSKRANRLSFFALIVSAFTALIEFLANYEIVLKIFQNYTNLFN